MILCHHISAGWSVSPINLYSNHKKTKIESNNVLANSTNMDRLFITLPTSTYYLDREFLEWFVGFADGEGNFHIRLIASTDNTYKSAQFTFQISLHKDEIKVLEYIMNTLKCGHISKYKDKINYFVNDIDSLLYVILPIFEHVNLNSSNIIVFKLKKKGGILNKRLKTFTW